MIEIEVSKIVTLCLSSFAIGMALANMIWTFHAFNGKKDASSNKELTDKGRDGDSQRKNRNDF